VGNLQQTRFQAKSRRLRLSGVTFRAYFLGMSGSDPTHHRPWRRIDRRVSRKIRVGSVEVGGDAPITVQSMTNTLTADANATIGQIRQLEEAGADIVRVSCPDPESTAAFKAIAKAAVVPLVADIHFHYKRGIEAAEAGAEQPLSRVKDVVQAARDNGCSMRIGVNAGSLERDLLEKYGEPCPEAMVESALFHARILQDLDFHEFKISVKASDVFMTVAAYQQLAEVIDCPLHLGVTEAGALRTGTIKSAIGIGNLLWSGIGDTIRISLAADPVEEIKAGFDILKSLGLRHRGVNIIACPSCARQGYNVIKTVEELESRLAHVSTPLSLSIIGCVVNGPGEALMTDIGFTGGGAGSGMVYVDGKPDHKMANDKMVDHIVELVEAKARSINAQESISALPQRTPATVAAE
jgi:(E)-4-hydroxy-3-methylbut-2-enyl-diphosphate synthase